jgi:hypothetical protein
MFKDTKHQKIKNRLAVALKQLTVMLSPLLNFGYLYLAVSD